MKTSWVPAFTRARERRPDAVVMGKKHITALIQFFAAILVGSGVSGEFISYKIWLLVFKLE
jgi:hypothetical protein